MYLHSTRTELLPINNIKICVYPIVIYIDDGVSCRNQTCDQWIKKIDGVLFFQMMDGQQMFIGEKAFQLIAITDAGISSHTGIIFLLVKVLSLQSILTLAIRLENNLDGCFSPHLFGDKEIFKFIQVDIFDGRPKKVLQCINRVNSCRCRSRHR